MSKYDNRYYAANRQRKKARDLKRMYGVSITWYLAQWQFQHGRCAICGGNMSKAQVDHDHQTGKARGLLCIPCNFVAQDKLIVQRALTYMETYSG